MVEITLPKTNPDDVNISDGTYATKYDDAALKTQSERSNELLLYGLPAVGAGIIDTMGQSVGLLDDEQLSETLKSAVPSFGAFYDRNKEVAQTVGDVATFWIPGMAGVKLFQGTKYAAEFLGLARGPIGRSLFLSGKNTAKLKNVLAARDRYLSRRRGVFAGLNYNADARRRKYAGLLKTIGVGDAMKKGVAFELGMYGGMNASQTLYPDEFSAADKLAFASLGVLIPGGIELAFLSKAARDSMRAAGVTTSFLERKLNVSDLAKAQIFRGPSSEAVVASRGEGLALYATMRGTIQDVLSTTNDKILATNLGKDIAQIDAIILKQVEKTFNDSMEGFGRGLPIGKEHKQTLMEALKEDPTTLLGTQIAQAIPESYAKMLDATNLPAKLAAKYTEQAEEVIAGINKYLPDDAGYMKELAKFDALKNKANFYHDLQLAVVETNGNLTLAAERRPRFSDTPDNIKNKIKTRVGTLGEPTHYETTIGKGNQARKLAVNSDFVVLTQPTVKAQAKLKDVKPIAAKFDDLTFNERSAIFALTAKNIKNFAKNDTTFAVNTTDNWLRLDAALTLRAQNIDNPNVLKRIKLNPAWGDNWDAVEYASVRGKYTDFLNQANKRDVTNIPLVPEVNRTNTGDIAYLLNLPGDKFGQTHPLLQLFESWRAQGVKQIDDIANSMDEVAQQMQVNVTLPELFPYAGRLTKTVGDNIVGQKGAPVLLTKRPINIMQAYTRNAMEGQALVRRQYVMTELLNADNVGAGIVASTTKEVLNHKEAFKTSLNVDNLIEGSQSGRGRFSQQAWAARDIPEMTALNQVVILSDRAAEETVARTIDQFVPVFNEIRATSNAGSLTSYNQFVQANRFGWELGDQFEENGRIFWRLATDKVSQAKNEKLWQKWIKSTGDKSIPAQMPENAAMPLMMRGQTGYLPLGVDKLANQAVKAVTSLSETVLNNTNLIRKLTGLGPIRRKPWHIPPERLGRDDTVYILKPSGGVQVVTGRTRQEAEARAMQIAKPGEAVTTGKDIKTFKASQLLDEPFANAIDMSDVMAQTGKGTKGSFYTDVLTVGPQLMNGHIESISSQLFLAARRTRGLLYEPQFNYAKTAHIVSANPDRDTSVFQMYNNMVFGNQALTPNTLLGKGYFAIDNMYGRILAGLWDKYGVAFSRGTAGQGGPKSIRAMAFGEDKQFKRLQEQMGEYMPLKSTEEYVNNTFHIAMPQDMKRHMAKLSQFTALLTLRFMELGHPILNLTSLMATAPAVINALNRMPGESIEAWKASRGAFGTVINDELIVFNSTRALVSATHFMFTKEGREVWKRGAKRGYFEQEVAELMRGLTAPQEGYAKGLLNKYASWTTMLSDKSERLSRALSFMTGYNIARKTGVFVDEEAMFAFAFKFANDVIGDYRPVNRPQMFQGAVGMPLGLFQTFMWNYMQRMFGYIENKQYRALATQYGMQAAVFGAESMPGFKTFVDVFATNYDGTVDPVTAFRRKFGDGLADVVLYGALSTVSKIFADDGIAFYTRGALDPKVITPFSLASTPVAGMATNMWGAFTKTVSMFMSGGQFSRQQAYEIMGQYSTNRPLKYLGEIMAGYSTDRRGQVISDDTTSALSIVARALGSRRLYETKVAEAYQRQRSSEFSQNAIRANLNNSFRALIRSGTLTDENLSRAMYDYFKSGGRPTGIASWLRDSFVIARSPKIQRRLIELTKGGKTAQALRLFQMMDLQPNDPEFD